MIFQNEFSPTVVLIGQPMSSTVVLKVYVQYIYLSYYILFKRDESPTFNISSL